MLKLKDKGDFDVETAYVFTHDSKKDKKQIVFDLIQSKDFPIHKITVCGKFYNKETTMELPYSLMQKGSTEDLEKLIKLNSVDYFEFILSNEDCTHIGIRMNMNEIIIAGNKGLDSKPYTDFIEKYI